MNIFEQVKAFNQALMKYRGARDLQAQEAFERGMKYFERYLDDRDSEYELTETFTHLLHMIQYNAQDMRGYLALSSLFTAVGDYQLAQMYLDTVNPKKEDQPFRELADSQAVLLWEEAEKLLMQQSNQLNRFNYPFLFHAFRDYFHHEVETLAARRIPEPSPRESTLDLLQEMLNVYQTKNQFFQAQIDLFKSRMDISGLKAEPDFLEPLIKQIKRNMQASKQLNLIQVSIRQQMQSLGHLQNDLRRAQEVTPGMEKKMLLILQEYQQVVEDLERMAKKKYKLTEIELPYKTFLAELKALIKWSQKMTPLKHTSLQKFKGKSLKAIAKTK